MSDMQTGGNTPLAHLLASDRAVQEGIKAVTIVAAEAPNSHFDAVIGLIDSSTKEVHNYHVHVHVKEIADEDVEVVKAAMDITE